MGFLKLMNVIWDKAKSQRYVVLPKSQETMNVFVQKLEKVDCTHNNSTTLNSS